ncbi:MAG TPA: Maf family protein [Aggregatilineaceae bacterium]|nr:Maf family protein [Aggregatilineaceae bacterium]
MTSQPNPTILLASASPRRRELLSLTGLRFTTAPADLDETVQPGEAARAYTIRLSQEKAAAALPAARASGAVVLAADTTVADGDDILGKPADADEARAMLLRLRGRAHQVITALTLIDSITGQSVTDVATTDVWMRDYSDAEIEAYIASGDPFDKAGGYAIQNTAFHPAEVRSGCFSNVVGLPLCHLTRSLRALGITPPQDVPAACQSLGDDGCDLAGAILSGRL